MKIISNTLLNLLMQKHSKELCIPECKTGATFVGKPPMRLDLWVMKKSWTNPYVYGYEIKVSRQDFLNDTKWPEYLKYCTDFYFVAPPGIIQPDELPPEAGLIICSVNGKRLYTKKKAPSRTVTIPDSIYRYVLMWRTKYNDRGIEQSQEDYWKQWLKRSDETKELGYNVSKKVQIILQEKVSKVQRENNVLKNENKLYSHVKAVLEELEITKDTIKWKDSHELKEMFLKKTKGPKVKLDSYLQSVIKTLQDARETIELS